jgi:type II secretory pathway pseudopilin PulG
MRRIDPAMRGFSLMEVTTALGVISFALVALLGVFPLGLENSRMSVSETRAAQLTTMVFATLATETSLASGSSTAGIQCFGSPSDTLPLPLDGTIYGETDSVPEVTAKLYASYDAEDQPTIVRDPSAAATAIYQLDVTFRPRTFSFLAPGGTQAQKRLTGFDVAVQVRGPNKRKPFFETSSFVPSFQRAAYAK